MKIADEQREREREWSKHMTSDERCPEYPLRGRMKKGRQFLTNSKSHVSLDFQGSFQDCRGYELKKALK